MNIKHVSLGLLAILVLGAIINSVTARNNSPIEEEVSVIKTVSLQTTSEVKEPEVVLIEDDTMESALALSLEELEKIRALEKVLPYDLAKAEKFDLPLDKIPSTSTGDLCYHFMTSPGVVFFGMYNDQNLGIRRALQASKTLQAFVERPDVMNGFIEVYQKIELDPEKNEELPGGRISMAVMHTDQLLLYPEIFEKSSGYEKEMLAILCERYNLMKDINLRYEEADGKDTVYSASFNTTKLLTFRLLEKYDKVSFERLKQYGSFEDEELFYESVGELVK